MKILLIYPYFLEKRISTEDIRVVPIGVYYIGALLQERGYDVEILNYYNLDGSSQEIRETLIKEKPDVIGFSILHGNRFGGVEIAKIAKGLDPNVKIVFGGVGTTFLWELLLKNFKEIDFAVIGEGEYTFLKLVQCIENKDEENFKNIKGLVFRDRNRIIYTGETDLIQDLDSLPIPAKYFSYQHLSLTRGCPGSCTFCGSPTIWGRKVRFHSKTYFVDQLALLYQKGITFFYFSDDTFTIKKDLVIQICKEILARNLKISWVAISRVNYIDEDMLYWMRLSGCSQISYGVESGSEEIRNRLNKHIRTDQIKKAFTWTTRYGILARAYFIYGCPGETWDTIQETIDLIHDIKPLSVIFYILDLFPGTSLYEEFREKFDITDDIWLTRIEDIMYFENDTNLSKELILSFGKKLRTDFYEHLHIFADSLTLVDNKALYEYHSGFFSKLAMTFSHGDYQRIDAIKDKDGIAEKLYQKSLQYMPNHRAFLGIGMIRQKNKDFLKSIKILDKGLERFPGSESLNICLGLSYMNLGEYTNALACFKKFQQSKQAVYYAASCYKALGDSENEALCLEKYNALD